ncbi:uncharacterized protein LOC133204091 [Saccostrea echinata]|uniref:uncharacterized protein LOC133204091 n=1 Tax=Saccostrea echinata TaxID=191078 RepID=UPI002A811BE4|nr:uncharacterized protein LOC133204091 [Saccostrea echinata]
MYSLQETAIEVKSCPTTKEEWLKASTKKNCSALYRSRNVKYEYHCVINEWGNSTLEVCAVNRFILYGKCAEYNYGAMRIQSSGMKMCSAHKPPCPDVYNSSDSYMYQGCYNISKTTGGQKTSDLISHYPNLQMSEMDMRIAIIVSISAVMAISVAVSIILWRLYRIQNNHNAGTAFVSEESSRTFLPNS